MKVLVLLAIFALAAAKQTRKDVVGQNTQVVDKYSQQYLPQQIWQQYMQQQKWQQYIPQQKWQQYVPEQKYQQYVPEQQQYYPQQYWPQGENSQIAQFITNYFYQAHQNKFTPVQFSSYLVRQGFPEFVVHYLTEQYEAFQNQPYVQSPYQTFQFYYKNGVPQEYYQWFTQHAFVAYPYHQEQYFEQYPINWRIGSPKTSQYQVDYNREEQQYPWSWKMSSPKTVQNQGDYKHEVLYQYIPYSPKYQSESQYWPKAQGFEQYGSQYPLTHQYGPYQQGSYGFNYNQWNKPYQYESYTQAYPYNYWNRQVVVDA